MAICSNLDVPPGESLGRLIGSTDLEKTLRKIGHDHGEDSWPAWHLARALQRGPVYLLSQLAADACQRRVVTGPVEATALGNVMVQAIATGHLAGLAEGRAAVAASIRQEEFTPGPAAGWDDAYTRYLKLSQN